ncbi:MAG TPA: AMP-binding protein, partial [Gemmatimonadaceae bacterium]
RYPASLRCVLLGGGPAPRTLLERCAAIGVPVAQTYGLTETTSQLATLAPADALRKLGAAGRPIYPNEIRIVTDGRDADPDEPGEILVRGPVVMAGYAGQPAATSRAIVDGWLHTGDAGSLDVDGYLRVLDRRDDLIITGGENVYPAEVEAVLLAHPWVAETGVIGVPDVTWGQCVVAFVRTSDHPSLDRANIEATLREHCKGQLASYKTPRHIRVVTEPLPRTASGKLRRALLRERVAQTTSPTG